MAIPKEEFVFEGVIAADADISQCHTLKAIKIFDRKGEERTREFDLSQDLNRLRAALQQMGNVRLIIIDPVSAYIGKTNDSNNAEIRGLMAPLSVMAADTGAAVVLITHLNKSTSQDAIGRVIGSIGMIAAARAGYAVSKDPKNPNIRYFVPLKNNIGNDRDGFSFTIQGRQLSDTIKSSRIIWGDSVDAQKVLHPEDEKPTQTNSAKAFLEELLADEPRMAEEIFEEAEGAGYSKQSIQRAATRLGVIRKKKGMKDGWTWRLPSMVPIPESGEDIEDAEDFTI